MMLLRFATKCMFHCFLDVAATDAFQATEPLIHAEAGGAAFRYQSAPEAELGGFREAFLDVPYLIWTVMGRH